MSDKFSKYAVKEDKFSKYRAPDHMQKNTNDDLESENQGTWASLYKGLKESYPETLKYGANALAQPFGKHPFEEKEEEPTTNWPEYLGRLGGKTGGYLTLAAPAIAAGEAAIPGLLGATIGSGLAGAALTQGGAKERAISGVESAALPAITKGLGSLFRLSKSAVSSVKPRQAADIIQKAHDVSHVNATEPFKKASQIATERNISATPIDKSIFNKIKSAFPKTPAYESLLKNAKKGDYESLRALSSDTKKFARKYSDPKKSIAENNYGEELQHAAEQIDKSQQMHFEKQGHKDLADLMKTGINKFAMHKDLYYKNPTIAGLVGEEKKVPKNLIETVGKDWSYFDKLRKAHPQLNKVIQREADQKYLKKLGIGTLGGGETINILKHLFSENKTSED